MSQLGDSNFITGFIINTLTPDAIYEHFTVIAGIAALAPWLFVIFLSFRILQEAHAGMSGKAAIGQALADSGTTTLVFIAYTAGGLLIFGLLLTIGQLFNTNVGSAQLIHTEMVELKRVLLADSEAQKDFFQKILEGIADAGNIFAAGFVWAMYQFVSTAYIFVTRMIDVMFAIGIALTYAWGFVAIVTMQLKGNFNLMPGFAKTILTFGIWLILEPILIFFLWLMSSGASNYLETYYAGSGAGVTAITLWYMFSCIMMMLVLIMKIIAPFLAVYLASNQSMVGALGAAPAAIGAMVANQVVSKLADNTINREMAGMMPTGDGMRTRDSLAQGMGDALHTPIGQLFGGGGSNNIASSGGGAEIPVPGSTPSMADGSSAAVPSDVTGAVTDPTSAVTPDVSGAASDPGPSAEAGDSSVPGSDSGSQAAAPDAGTQPASFDISNGPSPGNDAAGNSASGSDTASPTGGNDGLDDRNDLSSSNDPGTGGRS